MSTRIKLYKILLACPTDIIDEIEIVEKIASEWNKINGQVCEANVQIVHWSKDSYPEFGDRPQAILNKQLLQKVDIVVGVFWTHFGSPTGDCESGTEEEIKKGIALRKKIMVYFCNRPINPKSLDNEQFMKIKLFKKEFGRSGLYWEYKNLNEFERDFRRHLNNCMNIIFEEEAHIQKSINNNDKLKTMKKTDKIDLKEYITLDRIKTLINENFRDYFQKIMGIMNENRDLVNTNVVIKKDKNFTKNNIQDKLKEWELDINKYSNNFKKHFEIKVFDKYKIDYTAFKNNVFAKEPWTVNAALKTPDLELIRYRAAFSNVSGKEIFNAVKKILRETNEYVETYIPQYHSINKPEDLKYKFLENEDMLLPGVIGLGIRSEILHRLFPSNFSIMTRRSLWGMYFLADKSEDFIREEFGKDDRYRISHDWEYDYERFTYYTNYVSILIENELVKYDLRLKTSLWFGYAARFLNEISGMYTEDINYYLEWKKK